jgi:hypothetical protein
MNLWCRLFGHKPRHAFTVHPPDALGAKVWQWHLRDHWVCGRCAQPSPDLLKTMREAARKAFF